MIKPSWFDAFFILRPTLFFPSWTFFLAGYSRGEGSGAGWMLIWLGAAFGASFLLNQLTDRKEDLLNKKLLPRWGELVSEHMIYIELAVLILVIIAGCIFAGVELTGLLALFFLIAGVFYNFSPLRLKSRPILGIVSCAVGIWICYLIGARSADISYGAAILYGFPYALAGAAVSMLTHVPDLEGDIRAGMRTFPAVYGVKKTGMWAAVLVVICIAVSFLLSDYAILVSSLVSLPLFIRYMIRRDVLSADYAIKIAIFSLAVAIGFTWIPFLFLIAAYYPFARWYHLKRLGLDYPRFGSNDAVNSELTLKNAGL